MIEETETMREVAAAVDPVKKLKMLEDERREAIRILNRLMSTDQLRGFDGKLGTSAEWAAAEIRRLRADANMTARGQEESYRERGELQRRLDIALQANDRLTEKIDEQRKEIEALAGPQKSVHIVDLPDLPDSFVRAAMAALEAFAEGYAEYGPGAADALGLAGQWGDLHRKVAKLKPVMWEDKYERLTRETPQDILRDIIGHALLALDMYERGMEGGRE